MMPVLALADAEPSVEGAAPADTVAMTLPRCLQAATANSHRVAASRWEHRASRAVAEATAARRLPGLALAGDYLWRSEVNTVELPLQPPRVLEFGDHDVVELGLVTDVRLFTGGALAARIRAQRAEAEAALHQVASDSLQAIARTRRAFYRALGAQAATHASALHIERLQRHLEQVEGEQEIGTATREQRLQILSRLRAAEQDHLFSLEDARVGRLELGLAIGRPGVEISPEGGLTQTLLAPDMTGDAGPTERPEVAVLRSHQSAAESRARAARGAWWPQISATAGVHGGRPGIDPVDNEWMTWASAGLRLSWPLWDWGGRSAEVEQARARARAIAVLRDGLLDDLETARVQAEARLESARSRLTAARERAEFERERLGLIRSRRRTGMATLTELLDAQDDLAQAETAETVALAGVRLAEADLLYANGR